MATIIKNYFYPPDFSTDYFPDMGKTAHYIFIITIIALLYPLWAEVRKQLNGPSTEHLARIIIFLIQIITICICFILNKKRQTLRATTIYSFSITVFIFHLVLFSDLRVHDVAMFVYAASFVIASIFLEKKSYRVFVILQLSFIGINYYAEFQDPKIPNYDPQLLFDDYINAIISNTIIAIGTFILADNMKKGYRQATKNSQAFYESEQRLNSIINTTPNGIMMLDKMGNITFVNKIGQDICEIPEHSETGMYNTSQIRTLYTVHGERISDEDHPFTIVQRTGQSLVRKNYKIVFPNGRHKIVTMNIVPLFGKDVAPQGSIASFNDITGQMKAEEELVMRREQISSITSNLHAVFYRVELKKGKMVKPLFISDGAKELLGHTSDELMHDIRKFMSSIYRVDAMKDFKMLRELTEHPKPFELEHRVISKSGEIRWQRNSGIPYTKPDGTVIIDGFILDITAEKEVEQQLEMLGQAVNNSTEVIFLTDITEKIIFINPRFTELYGYSSDDVIGKVTPKILEHIPSVAVTNESLWKQLEEFKVVTTTFINKSKSGIQIEVESSLTPIIDRNGKLQGYLSIQRDITERHKIEEAIQQSKKMESLSTLAGGVAHEFNNLLTTILGWATMQQKKTESGTPAHNAFGKIEQAALRAAELTKQLTAYSGRSKFEIRIVNMNDIIKENLHAHTVSAVVPIDIRIHLAQDLLPVRADIRQMKQLIANIITNAVEATTEKNKSIDVRTAIMSMDQSQIQEWTLISKTTMAAGEYVVIEVDDMGIGMTDDVQQKIFDPFFSTKFTGRGLGLSAVLGILQGHHGGVIVHSTPNTGTTIRIALPAYRTEQAKETIQRKSSILTIDDDTLNLELVREIYESEGVKVFSSSTAADALSVFKEHQTNIVFILLDVNIPGSSCKETVYRLREINKRIPIVLTSGLPTGSIEDFSVMEVDDFLQKPYTPDALMWIFNKFSPH
jgi:PAS domain S-box-containing protein